MAWWSQTRRRGFAVGIECRDIIGKGFVFASVALILGGVFQKVAVQLPDGETHPGL